MTTYADLVATHSPMRFRNPPPWSNRVPVYRLTKADLPFVFAEGDVEVRTAVWPNGATGQLHQDSDGVRLFNPTSYRGSVRNSTYYVWKEPRDGDR